MTSEHLIFIPAILAVGIGIGFILASRAAKDRANLELKRDADRKKAREERAKRKAGKAAKSSSEAGDAA